MFSVILKLGNHQPRETILVLWEIVMVISPSQEYRVCSRDWLGIALDTVKAFRGADHPEGWAIWRDLCQEIKWTRYQEALWWHHHNASSALCTAELPDPILPQMKMCFLSPNYLTMPGMERSICWGGCGQKAKSPFHPNTQQSTIRGLLFFFKVLLISAGHTPECDRGGKKPVMR